MTRSKHGAWEGEGRMTGASPDGRRIQHWEDTAALDSVAVHVLCGPLGCDRDGPCPFDPICAADLVPREKRRLIIERFDALTACAKKATDDRP